MWQEALWSRGRYLLEKSDGGEGAEGPDGLGGDGFQVEAEGQKPQDWLYESYYRMSQQHPLIVFLLLIVMGTCLALLAVFFASGLVSEPASARGGGGVDHSSARLGFFFPTHFKGLMIKNLTLKNSRRKKMLNVKLLNVLASFTCGPSVSWQMWTND